MSSPYSLVPKGQMQATLVALVTVTERIKTVIIEGFDRYKPADVDVPRHIYLAGKSVQPEFPTILIRPTEVRYIDRPQQFGYTAEMDIELAFYTHQQDNELNALKQLAFGDTLRRVFLFNESLESRAEGKLVYQCKATRVDFGTFVIPTYQGADIGVYGGILALEVLWEETGA